VPSLNEFHAEYQDKGVRLLALSDEGAAVVGKFVEEQGLQYPVGIDGGGKTGRSYGVTGYPTAFVIDADGEVTWRGHPGNHQELVDAVEAARKNSGFIELPKDLDPKLEKVAEALADQELGTAHKWAQALSAENDATVAEQAKDVVAKIEALVQSRHDRADALLEKGAYYDALCLMEKLAEKLDGSDLADAAEDRAKAIGKDPAAKDDLKAGESFQKALKMAAQGKDEQFQKSLQSILKKYPDTQVAAKVRKLTEA